MATHLTKSTDATAAVREHAPTVDAQLFETLMTEYIEYDMPLAQARTYALDAVSEMAEVFDVTRGSINSALTDAKTTVANRRASHRW
jgi:hypothetical protein